MKKLAILIPLMLSNPTVAGVDSDLGSFFDGLTFEGNATLPQSYQGQAANYYTGGSAYIRTPVKQMQLATITVPEINAGCGGIDLFAGGFSFINSDQLVSMGKAIVSNAVPFAVDLALQTWAPQLKNVKDRLEAIAREINALSVNSCEAAQAGISALAGFAGVGEKNYICATMGTQNNSFADWAAAKNGCNNEASANQQVKNATNDPKLKDFVAANRNIIWYSLHKNGFLSGDRQLAEFFMSLSGTIIYDDKMSATRYPSLLTSSNNLIEVMTQGGETSYYRCDTSGQNGCLKPTQATLTINQDKALKHRVAVLLRSIITKYRSDQGLSNNETQFLDSVSLPVLKMMTVSLESGYSLESSINAYAQVISTDLVTAYLQDALKVIQGALDSKGSNPEDVAALYIVIGQASEQMRLSRIQALQTLEAEQSIIRATMELEQRVEGSFSGQARQNLLFGQDE
ncbi:conjugal transfer protein TraH [Photobacterium damselae]|uniref:conjugal transfer protein TraH n=1 Tax=Photobacterium damselae TaxID=38293 RepID=UPI00189ED5FB|nr:conjugal transfer protein TraH [Photobacterium damselae]MBF7101100.1 conjugal transfer protein TraH [Photobacterium damselae]